MHIEVNREQLIRAAQVPTGVTGKSDKAATESLKFTFINNTIQITAFNNGLETNFFCLAVSANDTEPFMVNATSFYRLINGYPKNAQITLMFNPKKTHLIVQCKRSKHQLELGDATTFPEITAFQNTQTKITLGLEEFNSALNHVKWACKTENNTADNRAYLSSVHLEVIENGSIALTASDGHKMIHKSLPATIEKNDYAHVLLPKRIIDQLAKCDRYGISTVTLEYNVNMVQMTLDGLAVIKSTLSAAKYPDLSKFINNKPQDIIIVNRLELKMAIDRMIAGVTNAEQCGMLLTLAGSDLAISNKEADRHEYLELQGDEPYAPFSGAYQYKMLNDAMSSMSGEHISIGMNDERLTHITNHAGLTIMMMEFKI